MEKFEYKPGQHTIAEKFGSPSNYLLLPFLELSVLSNSFPFVEVRDGLPEGKGLFAKTEIPLYTFVCNYGGKLMTKKEGFSYLDRDGDFCYLYEFSFEKAGKKQTFFLNHTPSSFSFGKFINHSRLHFNVLPKVFFRSDGKPEIMFISSGCIAAGDEILFDYGRLYKGVQKCVTSCQKCKFLFENK